VLVCIVVTHATACSGWTETSGSASGEAKESFAVFFGPKVEWLTPESASVQKVTLKFSARSDDEQTRLNNAAEQTFVDFWSDDIRFLSMSDAMREPLLAVALKTISSHDALRRLWIQLVHKSNARIHLAFIEPLSPDRERLDEFYKKWKELYADNGVQLHTEEGVAAKTLLSLHTIHEEGQMPEFIVLINRRMVDETRADVLTPNLVAAFLDLHDFFAASSLRTVYVPLFNAEPEPPFWILDDAPLPVRAHNGVDNDLGYIQRWSVTGEEEWARLRRLVVSLDEDDISTDWDSDDAVLQSEFVLLTVNLGLPPIGIELWRSYFMMKRVVRDQRLLALLRSDVRAELFIKPQSYQELLTLIEHEGFQPIAALNGDVLRFEPLETAFWKKWADTLAPFDTLLAADSPAFAPFDIDNAADQKILERINKLAKPDAC